MGDMDLPILCQLIAGNTILSCTQATGVSSAVTWHIVVHLNRSGSKLVKVSSNTVYSLGFVFIFLPTFFFAFLLIAAFSFLAFITASVFIFSFSFLINSFLAFSVSISFTILKFSSVVIQNDLKTFFLIVIFLVKVGIVIRSSKEKLLPILKNFF